MTLVTVPGMCFSSECASDFWLLDLLRAARCASTAMTSGLPRLLDFFGFELLYMGLHTT
jgi:hypothetical protein